MDSYKLTVSQRMSLMRVTFKRWLSKRRLIVEFCKDCGRTQPLIWAADDLLWTFVARGTNVLCPECFDRRAARLGVCLRWVPGALVEPEVLYPVGASSPSETSKYDR